MASRVSLTPWTILRKSPGWRGGVGAHVEPPVHRRPGERPGVGHQRLQVGPHLLDGVVDEALLARQGRHGGVELAAPEAVHHRQRLAGHGEVGPDHPVDAAWPWPGTAPRSAPRRWPRRSPRARARRSTRLISATSPCRLPRTCSTVSLMKRFLPGSGSSTASKRPRPNSAKIPMALPLHRDVGLRHPVHAAGHLGVGAREARLVHHGVDLAALVLGAHAVHLVDEGAERGRRPR